MHVPVAHQRLGTLLLVNSPVKLSRTPAGIRGSSPDMGAHSREVLKDHLGMSDKEIDALASREVVWEERPPVDLG